MRSAPQVPDKPSLDGIEDKWSSAWEEAGTYRFDRTKTRDQVYSIDTPPPTVSGSLHVGHVFSYTHTDCMARYKRMRGFEVFYPMGWDDNGLPTERRVQNYYGVRCDPSLPYEPDFEPPEKPDAKNQLPDLDATSWNCASASPSRTRRPSRNCGAEWACRSIGRRPIRRSTQCPSHQPARLPAQSRPR
jgi:hypothetical protein